MSARVRRRTDDQWFAALEKEIEQACADAAADYPDTNPDDIAYEMAKAIIRMSDAPEHVKADVRRCYGIDQGGEF